jgi:hypothetical protein
MQQRTPASYGWSGQTMDVVTAHPTSRRHDSPISNSTSWATLGAATCSSAVVREYLCLFTRDLRRKQKRWEDGRLKYHTFNKRVMVYDERGNFVGDMHWQSGWDFDVGEEVQLERGGVIVQVSDCVGQETQDLSGLLDKRVQEREERFLHKEQRRMASSRVGMPNHSPTSGGSEARLQQQTPRVPQIRHRPLTALLGTPTGHHARALAPSESPYEQKKMAADATPISPSGADRPTKRRRQEEAPSGKMGYAQSLFGATLSLSGTPSSSLRWTSQTMSRQTVPAVAGASRARQRRTVEVEIDNNRDQREIRDLKYQDSADRSVPVAVAISRPRRSPPRPCMRSSEQVAEAQAVSRAPSPYPVSPFDLRLGPQESQPVPEVVDLTVPRADWDSMDLGITSRNGGPFTSKTSHGEVSKKVGQVTKVISIHRPSRNVSAMPIPSGEPIGRVKDPVEEPAPRPVPGGSGLPEDTRRTELQLKSRRKRGLLMLAEHVDVGPKAKSRKPCLPVEVALSSAVEEEVEARPLGDDMFFGIGSEPSSGINSLSKALAETSATHLNLCEPTQCHFDANLDPPSAGPSGSEEGDEEPVKGERKTARDAITAVDTQNEHENSPQELSPEGHPTQQLRSKQPLSEVGDDDAPDEGQQADAQDQPDEPPARRGRSARTLARLKRQLVDDEPVVREPDRQPEPTTERRATRKATLKKQRLSTASEEDQPSSDDRAVAMPLPRAVAPRLVKFGRKSVRSKEVVGFMMEDAVVPTGSQYRGLSASTVTSARVSTNNEKSEQESEVADRHTAALGIMADLQLTTTRATQKPPSQTTPGRGKPSQVGSSVQVQSLLVSDACVGPKSAAPGAIGLEQVASMSEEAIGVKDSKSMASVPHVAVEASIKKVKGSQHQQGLAATVEPGLPAVESVRIKQLLDRDTNSVPLESCAREESSTAAFPGNNETVTVADQIPRIANPATRGRKAALRSHAAGQAPLPALPLDLMRGGAQQAQPRATLSQANPPGGVAPSKRKMTYPGFTSAKEGGPWSREAHDLLDYVRPS